jgi:hypothetical protein
MRSMSGEPGRSKGHAAGSLDRSEFAAPTPPFIFEHRPTRACAMRAKKRRIVHDPSDASGYRWCFQRPFGGVGSSSSRRHESGTQTQKAETQMKGCCAILVMAFVSAAGAGHSQDMTPPPPIKPEDIGNYCVYANRIYSTGSQICVVRGSVALGCEKGEWKVDLTKFGLDCKNETAAAAGGERR